MSYTQDTLPLSAVATERLSSIDAKALRTNPIPLSEPGPMRFAISQAVQITPQTFGTWEHLPGGGRLWRLRLEAPGATDLNLGFRSYWLPWGATLHILSERESDYEGPYTAHDNKPHGQLWTPPVPGDRITLELYVPGAAEEAPQLTLVHVGVGYRDILRRQSFPKNHGTCHIDVVCPQGNNWRDEIRSVAMLTIGGTGTCTGTLIMDVPGTFRPFVLTAAHCRIDPTTTPTVVALWNFQATTCGAQTGASTQSQSGATFRASEADVDMALIELDDRPDASFEVYYAGWDRSGITPQGSVGIHHPRADVKSISINTDPLTSDVSCLSTNVDETHWIVDNWEEGVTEEGSSGSGLWDAGTKHLVGMLSGGTSFCSNPDGSDCYGKFSVAWARGLSAVLDPNNQGALTVSGANPETSPESPPAIPPGLAPVDSPGLAPEKPSIAELAPVKPITLRPVATARSSGGGCAVSPGARFDPTLIGVLGLMVAYT